MDKKLGGWKQTYKKSMGNFKVLSDWYENREWVSNSVKDKKIQSNSSICLEINDKRFLKLDIQKNGFLFKRCVLYLNKIMQHLI